MEDGARLFVCFRDKVNLYLDFKFTPTGFGNLEWWTFNGCWQRVREVSGLSEGTQVNGSGNGCTSHRVDISFM